MKNFILIALLSVCFVEHAQNIEPTYKAAGDLVKATYYYTDGTVKVEGFFKDKKLTGQWVKFDKNGNKVQIANYKEGQKVGKWFFWSKDALREINYDNNAVVSINTWKSDSKVAFNR